MENLKRGSSAEVVGQMVGRSSRGSAMQADPGRFTSSGKNPNDPAVQVLPFVNDSFKGVTQMESGKISVNPTAQSFTLAHEMRHRMQADMMKNNPGVAATYLKQEQQMKTVLDGVIKRGVDLRLPGFSGDTGPGELEGQLAAYVSQLPAGKSVQDTPLLKGADPATQVVLLRMLAGRADGGAD